MHRSALLSIYSTRSALNRESPQIARRRVRWRESCNALISCCIVLFGLNAIERLMAVAIEVYHLANGTACRRSIAPQRPAQRHHGRIGRCDNGNSETPRSDRSERGMEMPAYTAGLPARAFDLQSTISCPIRLVATPAWRILRRCVASATGRRRLMK